MHRTFSICRLLMPVPVLAALLFLLIGSTHASIKQDGLTLVTHHHYVVAVRIDSPVRIHLNHSQEVIHYHTVTDVHGVYISTLLEDKGDILPVWMEHHINNSSANHVASLGCGL